MFSIASCRFRSALALIPAATAISTSGACNRQCTNSGDAGDRRTASYRYEGSLPHDA